MSHPSQPRTAIDENHPVPAGEPPQRDEIAVPAQTPHGRGARVLLGVGLVLIGLNLRIGVAAIGPVISDIQADLGISSTVASLLTTIPVFAFGAFAFLTPLLTRRLGLHRLLGLTMLLLAVGLAVRMNASLLALFTGTVLVGAAIAVSNVLMPAAVKLDFSHRAGLMMGLYSTSLFVGAAVASGLTVPIMHAVGGSWRPALGAWTVPAVLALVLWLPQFRRSPGQLTTEPVVADAPSERGEPPFRAILTDPTALAVTALMGLQSVAYYVALTWVPTILQDAGMDANIAGLMLAYSAAPAILTALISPAVAHRVRPHWLVITLATLLIATAFLGLAVSPTRGTLWWMTLMGLGQGGCISLSLSYIVWRAPDAHHTGHLSTMSQGFGYLLAGLGPLGIGAVHSMTGGWTAPIIVLGALLAAQLVSGVLASRPVHVRARPVRD